MTKREEQQTEREEYKIKLEKHRIYTERIKALDDRILSNSQIVSRSVLYLSAVGMGFIIKSPDILTTNTYVIIATLILFTLAIVITLISFPISDRILEQEIKRIDKEEKETSSTKGENNPCNEDPRSKTITWLSYFSIALFLAAIVILLLTLLLNLTT